MAEDRKPFTSADLLKMQNDERERRARNKLHRKGPPPIHGHVGLEEADAEARRLARLKSGSVGNDPSKLPDVSVTRGQTPKKPGQ